MIASNISEKKVLKRSNTASSAKPTGASIEGSTEKDGTHLSVIDVNSIVMNKHHCDGTDVQGNIVTLQGKQNVEDFTISFDVEENSTALLGTKKKKRKKKSTKEKPKASSEGMTSGEIQLEDGKRVAGAALRLTPNKSVGAVHDLIGNRAQNLSPSPKDKNQDASFVSVLNDFFGV